MCDVFMLSTHRTHVHTGRSPFACGETDVKAYLGISSICFRAYWAGYYFHALGRGILTASHHRPAAQISGAYGPPILISLLRGRMKYTLLLELCSKWESPAVKRVA